MLPPDHHTRKKSPKDAVCVSCFYATIQTLSELIYGCRYMPLEELEGRLVTVVCNLKPAKLKGIESAGMVLAAGTDTVAALHFAPYPRPSRVFHDLL
jgi:hypothetical protein